MRELFTLQHGYNVNIKYRKIIANKYIPKQIQTKGKITKKIQLLDNPKSETTRLQIVLHQFSLKDKLRKILSSNFSSIQLAAQADFSAEKSAHTLSLVCVKNGYYLSIHLTLKTDLKGYLMYGLKVKQVGPSK